MNFQKNTRVSVKFTGLGSAKGSVGIIMSIRGKVDDPNTATAMVNFGVNAGGHMMKKRLPLYMLEAIDV